MGNSRGWQGLFGNRELREQVAYDSLVSLPATQRIKKIDAVLRQAKVRMPGRKAPWLAANLETIRCRGGLKAIRAEAMALPTREAKLQFMRAFKGIGEKYARNMWMDLYDPLFRDSIAIDERIKRITAALGATFTSYLAEEAFYRDIACEAGLEAWEVDRLLYQFRDDFLDAIGG